MDPWWGHKRNLNKTEGNHRVTAGGGGVGSTQGKHKKSDGTPGGGHERNINKT